MSKILIFCSSYTSISQAFSVMAFEGDRSQIQIIVSNPLVLKVFNSIKLPAYVQVTYLPRLNANVAGTFFYFQLRGRIWSKSLYREILKNGPYEKIYFFSHLFWDLGLSVIQKLSKHFRIIFWNSASTYLDLPDQRLSMFGLRWFLGAKNLRVIKMGPYSCSTITEKFIRDSRIQEIQTLEPESEKLRSLISSVTSEPMRFKVLILADGVVGAGELIPDAKKYNETYGQILEVLFKYFEPKSILVKPHPSIIQNQEIFEPFINEEFSSLPAEFLVHDGLELVLGTASTFFGQIPKSKNPPILISHINYIYEESGWKTTHIQTLNEMIERAKAKDQEILTPASVEDFRFLMKQKFADKKTYGVSDSN